MRTNNFRESLKGNSGKIYRDSIKFSRWVELVLDTNNKQTYGNFTQAALIAYDLDPNNPTDYNSACRIGSDNYRKLQDLASLYLQKKNISFGFLMDILITKMVKSNSIEWWNIVMDFMRYDRPNKNPAVIPIQQNNQYNYNLADKELDEILKGSEVRNMTEQELIDTFVTE